MNMHNYIVHIHRIQEYQTRAWRWPLTTEGSSPSLVWCSSKKNKWRICIKFWKINMEFWWLFIEFWWGSPPGLVWYSWRENTWRICVEFWSRNNKYQWKSTKIWWIIIERWCIFFEWISIRSNFHTYTNLTNLTYVISRSSSNHMKCWRLGEKIPLQTHGFKPMTFWPTSSCCRPSLPMVVGLLLSH